MLILCRLKRGFKAVDANKRRYSEILYPGKTEVAHINHYMCRSFENWMNRVERGGAAYSKENYPKNKDHRWRFERELCESKFYELEKQTNELIDEFMLKYWSDPCFCEIAKRTQPRFAKIWQFRPQRSRCDNCCSAPAIVEPHLIALTTEFISGLSRLNAGQSTQLVGAALPQSW